MSDRSNQPKWHVWQIQSAHMACVTDPINPHGTPDRSIQQTRHASQTQSALMACLTDPISTQGMLDRSNQPVFSILDLGLQWCFHCKFSYFCIGGRKKERKKERKKKNQPILVTYIYTQLQIQDCWGVTLFAKFHGIKVPSFSGSSSQKQILNHVVTLQLPPLPIPSNNMVLHPTFSNSDGWNSSTAHMKTADRISSDSECVFLLDKIEM
jgi:hypothetical protein